MYAREIDAQYDCRECHASAYEWAQRGHCTEARPDGGSVQLRIDVDGKTGTDAYPEMFETCPKGLLRADLHSDEVTIAAIVSSAAAAEVEKRWPDVPARLYALLREWREAEGARMTAEHEARLAAMPGAHRGH